MNCRLSLIFYTSIIIVANSQNSDGFHYNFKDVFDAIQIGDQKRFKTVLDKNNLTIHLYKPIREDEQLPHPKDEFYMIVSGNGKYVINNDTVNVATGDLVFAPKYLEHRFIDFSKDFSTWVIFYEDMIDDNASTAEFEERLINDFIETWKRTKQYTLKILELMPEEFYFKEINKNSRNFAEEALHIADNLYFLSTNYILETGKSKVNLDFSTKADIVLAVDKAFDFFQASVGKLRYEHSLSKEVHFFNGKTLSKQQILYLVKDHTSHHRSKMVTMLKAYRIEPPEYIGW